MFLLRRVLPEGESTSQGTKLPPAKVYDIETSTDKSARTFKHLIRANHVNRALVSRDPLNINLATQLLASAYVLGADSPLLMSIYDHECEQKGFQWEDSPNEVSTHDWRSYLGDLRYQRAYVDFFEDELVRLGYDWKKLVMEYLLSGDEPLINGIMGGLGCPLIQLGHAFEFNSPTLAVEALALGAVFYSERHKYLDNPSFTRAPKLGYLQSCRNLRDTTFELENTETAFKDLFGPLKPASPAAMLADIDKLFRKREKTMMDYWNAWLLWDPPEDSLRELQRIIILTIVGIGPTDSHLDACISLLLSSYAARVLLPHIPASSQRPLMRQLWLHTLSTSIISGQPDIHEKFRSHAVSTGTGWSSAKNQVLKLLQEGYFPEPVTVIRTLMSCAEMWGDRITSSHDGSEEYNDMKDNWNHDLKDGWFLKAALGFLEPYIKHVVQGEPWPTAPEEDNASDPDGDDGSDSDE